MTDTACQILDKLKDAQIRMLTGSFETKVRYRSDTGAEREMQFAKTDIQALEQAIQKYQALCDVENGVSTSTAARRCFIAGR